jgi:NTF2-related export protein 1/2
MMSRLGSPQTVASTPVASISTIANISISLAAEKFVESYYPALNSPKGRAHLTEFYIKPTESSPLQPDITLNGNTVADAAQLQSIFENQVSKAQYEVQSFDCQVVNTNYNVGVDESRLGPNKDGRKMSILVMVNGSVKYFKENTDGETRGFTESVVLIPNLEAQGPKAAKGAKRWLIQSQTFRLVL